MTDIVRWAVVLLCVGLVGCVSADARRMRAVEASLVGQTQEQLVACAGPPQGETQEGGLAVLTYYKSCGALEQGFPTARGTVARESRHGCRATVEVRGGHVSRVQFEAVPDGASYEVYHCEELFAACGVESVAK